MKEINPIAAQIANSPSAKLAAKLASSPAAKAAMQMTNNPMVKAATQMANNPMVKAATRISRIAQPYAEALQKFSHIEWVGKIPMNWELARMKNVGEYINGYAFKPDDWSNYGLPIIRIQDLTGSSENPNYYDGVLDDKYKVLSGDILVSWAATLDAFTWTKHTGWLNQHIFKAIPNTNKIEKKFFIFLAKEAMQHMNNDNKHGIVMQHVTLGMFNNFKVPLPPLSEQQAIADYLDEECARIDGIVTTQRQIIERLKEYKKSVITEAVTCGLNPDTPMKDSGIDWIGKIPKHWEICRMRTLGKFTSSGIDKKINPEEPLVRIINYTDVYGNKTCTLENKDYMTVSAPASKIKENLVQKGDLIFTPSSETIEDIGLSALVNTNLEHTAFSYHVLRFAFSKDFYHQYKKYLCNNHYVLNYFSANAKGTVRQTLDRDDFKSCQVIVPPLLEQQAIADYLDKECAHIDTIIEKRERMIELMTEYKKSLIYECVTGKKEIVDVVE